MGECRNIFISPCGKAPSNLNVIKVCMWAPFAGGKHVFVIFIVQQFFLAAHPSILAVRIDLKGDLYNS